MLSSTLLPFFYCMVPLLKPNIRKKGTLIISWSRRNLERDGPHLPNMGAIVLSERLKVQGTRLLQDNKFWNPTSVCMRLSADLREPAYNPAAIIREPKLKHAKPIHSIN